jgi:hypothetical protein
MASSSRVGFTALSLSSRRNLVTPPRHGRRRLRWRIGLETPNSTQGRSRIGSRDGGSILALKDKARGVRHVDLEVASVSRGGRDEPSMSEAAPHEVIGEPLVGDQIGRFEARRHHVEASYLR